jgi:hypothetical protein
MNKKKKAPLPKPFAQVGLEAPMDVICKEKWIKAKETIARVGLPKELTKPGK